MGEESVFLFTCYGKRESKQVVGVRIEVMGL